MNKKLTQIALAFLAATSVASAQSDGKSFDATVILAPGLTIERNGNLYGNDWSMLYLEDEDVLMAKGDGTGESYFILTTDGSVLAMSAGTTMKIEGSARGFGVFQTNAGNSWIAGNINRGYVLPDWFRLRLPYSFGNVTVIDDGFHSRYPALPLIIDNNSVPFSYGFPPGSVAYGGIYTLPWYSTFTIPGIR